MSRSIISAGPFDRGFTKRRRLIAAGSVIVGLVLAGCSSSDEAAPETSTPVVTTSSTSKSTSKTTTTSATTTTTTSTETPTPTPTPEPPPPGPTTSPLTGLAISANPVLAAKIDNTNFGGLQYGTSKADLVYVEQVEGGLTRLVAVFQSVLPEEVGPVRSVRTTDGELLRPLGSPALLFSGGAGLPVELLHQTPVVDASQEVIGDAYWRSSVASGSYNLHANVAQIATSVSGISQPKEIGFQFGADYPAIAAGRDVTSLNVSMQSPIRWEYADGVYHYIRQGEVSEDGIDGAVIAPVNLLVQNVQNAPDGVVDSAGSPSYKTDTVGSGTFTLYRDGKAIDGSWSRTELDGPTTYMDGAGHPILLKPGQTWVMLAPQNSTISEN